MGKKLEGVHLEGVNLTLEQVEEVLEVVLDQHSNTEVLDLSYNGELDKVSKELKAKVGSSVVEAYLHINPPPPPPPADVPAPPAHAPALPPAPPANAPADPPAPPGD